MRFKRTEVLSWRGQSYTFALINHPLRDMSARSHTRTHTVNTVTHNSPWAWTSWSNVQIIVSAEKPHEKLSQTSSHSHANTSVFLSRWQSGCKHSAAFFHFSAELRGEEMVGSTAMLSQNIHFLIRCDLAVSVYTVCMYVCMSVYAGHLLPFHHISRREITYCLLSIRWCLWSSPETSAEGSAVVSRSVSSMWERSLSVGPADTSSLCSDWRIRLSVNCWKVKSPRMHLSVTAGTSQWWNVTKSHGLKYCT